MTGPPPAGAADGSPSPPRVRLVVLNYNGGENVVRSVEALTKLDWPTDRLEVVVVDNVSTDGSADAVEERFPDVRVVRNTANTGFPANNLALRDLDGIDYVGLVNPDAFVEPDWLRPLVAGLEADPALGAACGRMVFADRFVSVEVRSPTFVPGATDRRELGVMLHGARLGGEDRWPEVQVFEGGWGLEHGRRGETFQWTAGRAMVGVPVSSPAPEPAGAGPAPDPVSSSGPEENGPLLAPGAVPRLEEPGQVLSLLLSAEAVKQIELSCGRSTVTAEVSPEPSWVDIPAGGAEPLDVVNNVGSVVFDDGYGADRGYLEPDEGQYDQPAEVFAWCGANVLLRPAYLADAGLFDQRFFLYYEDTDLSWRGQGRGWRYLYVPAARVRHVHSASTGEGSALFQHYVERNRLLMLVKNAPAPMVRRAVWRFLLVTLSYARRDLVRPLLARRRPRPEQVRRRIGSLLGFLRLLPVMWWQRRRIRRRATVPDDDLRVRLTSRG